MKFIVFLGFLFITGLSFSQSQTADKIEREKFIVGFSLGASSLGIKFPDNHKQEVLSFTFPNLKIGSMINSNTAILLYLPGTVYPYKNEGRKRDRGFEGIVPSVQYWFNERWWVLGGVGLGMDAPAFYDIEDESERKFYFGGAAVAGSGYEIWKNDKFVLDLQTRLHYGTARLDDGTRNGSAFSILIGFNWY